MGNGFPMVNRKESKVKTTNLVSSIPERHLAARAFIHLYVFCATKGFQDLFPDHPPAFSLEQWSSHPPTFVIVMKTDYKPTALMVAMLESRARGFIAGMQALDTNVESTITDLPAKPKSKHPALDFIRFLFTGKAPGR
jgi:hypothetical protein